MASALIFDSGVGGLSVAAEIKRLLPGVRQVYVADDAFRPYGDKTGAQLNARLPGLLSVLTEITRPDIVVIACNTASTTALPGIRAALDVPVVGVVPAIKPAAGASVSGIIGVLGTPATIARKYVGALIDDFAAGVEVRLQGSVNLVHQAENKLAGQPVDLEVIRRDIAPLFKGQKTQKIDQIVLACTHFPLLAPELEKAAPYPVRWVDSGAAIARRVKALLLDAGHGAKDISQDAPNGPALLIGPNCPPARSRAFAGFGFNQVIGLEPSHQ